MKRVGLDQDAVEIHRGQQLPQYGTLVRFTGVVGGLGNGHTQGLGVERHLRNERTAATVGLDNRAAECLAVAHELIKTHRTTWDLGEHPPLQLPADLGHINLQEQIAEGGISGWPPELKTQRLVQRSVMAEGKALQIPQALAATQDPEDRHQEQKPLGEAHPTTHPSLWDRLQKADQVGRGISRRGFWQRRDPFPPTKPNARSNAKLACDRLSISPGVERPRNRPLQPPANRHREIVLVDGDPLVRLSLVSGWMDLR